MTLPSYNIDTVKEGQRVAFLANIKTATIVDEDLIERTVLSLYMIEPNGQTFHAYLRCPPYFYITCKEDLLKYRIKVINANDLVGI